MSSKFLPFRDQSLNLTTSNGNLRLAELSDLEEIAAIHLKAFPDFFLSQLGVRFLYVMYKAFLLNPSGIFVVYETDRSSLSGFAVGHLQGTGSDRNIALRFLPEFIYAAIPALIRHPVLISRRLIMRFFDIGDKPEVPAEAALLRSIAVNPNVRGHGLAARLLQAFESLACDGDAHYVYLTTDGVSNVRAQRFYERQGYKVAERFRQDRSRWMWLMKKKIC